MARRRRYPAKKTTKKTSKNPYERMGNEAKKKLKNLPPKKSELDYQVLPRKLLEIQEASKEAAKPRTRSGKKRAKNKFYDITSRMGFKKLPWEDDDMLANRVLRDTNRALDKELLKVMQGTAGRDTEESDRER